MAELEQKIALTAEDRTRAAFESAKARLNGLGSAAISLRTAMAGLGLAGFGMAVQEAVDLGSRMSDLSKRLGTSTEFLSRLSYASQQVGIDFESAARGVGLLGKNASEAARGTGKAQTAFKALGLDARQFAQLSIEDQFLTVSEALSRVQNAGDRAALAMQLFGRGGIELLQITNDGAAGLGALFEQADKVGATMSGETAASLDAAGDAMGNLATAAGNLGAAFVGSLAPGLTAIANVATAVLKPALDVLRSVFSAFFGFASAGFKSLAQVLTGDLKGAFETIVNGAGEAGKSLADDLRRPVEDAMGSFKALGGAGGALSGEIAKKVAAAQGRTAGFDGNVGAAADEEALIKIAKRIQAVEGGRAAAAAASILQPQLQQMSASRLATGAFRGKPVQVESPVLREIKAVLERIEKKTLRGEIAAVLG